MFLVDDILLSPMKGLLYICKQIHKAAEDDFLNEGNISARLSELYMMLDTGMITEEVFNKKESELLNRLEQIEEYKKKHFESMNEENIENDEDGEVKVYPKERKNQKEEIFNNSAIKHR
ncbi:MAG TPA: gas vesicle protein GvpG [Candidatus Wujingus californicus]|uniref:gas vesicle protein GvpG n=1 Tax=Candidatus Wujingus californicus TaxID=3367618 RepID=UPI001D8A717B|nr:gas vesicle protein GvpG [Planctomycetota bacterium]MDO8130782.1 gas vesicle protein GvpG [Candidatus Brocadiales bacterium]